MTTKLTLSVDPQVVKRAKASAKRRGTSLSQLVERFLDLWSKGSGEHGETPVLRRLRGSLSGADPAAYRRHLLEKHR